MPRLPTQRSLALLRKDGWTAGVVEKWNPHARIRQDLFGFVDIIAVKPGKGILALQVTSGANLASRLAKIVAEPRAALWLRSGGLLEAHGWRLAGQRGKRKTWQVRRCVFGLTVAGVPGWWEA